MDRAGGVVVERSEGERAGSPQDANTIARLEFDQEGERRGVGGAVVD